ncbi:unnamed protein product [Spirodela intermedia]|uniref:Uncharacterized protein n=1 Tax=Spirodela intermedia TaxID=51605 RepID=A0A7I8KHW3_SPIIN|nr:unnamed protein product [Spirodela intermedia]
MAEDLLEGTVHAEVAGATADQVWRLLDFCNIQRVMATMESCTRVEGIDGEPGCKRYCVGKPTAFGYGGEAFVPWAYERLLAIDPAERSYWYKVTDSNLGLRGYTAEMKVIDDGSRCTLEWSFTAESLGMTTRDTFVQNLRETLRGIAQCIEAAVASGEA